MFSKVGHQTFWWPKLLSRKPRPQHEGHAHHPNHRIAVGVFDLRQNMSLISTSDGKRLRANTHTGGRRRNSLRLLLPHHSMRGDERGD